VSLLAEIIDRFDARRFQALRDHLPELPRYLLGRAQQLNPIVASQPDRTGAIASAIARANQTRQAWRDPETYYPIFTLADEGANPDRTETLLTQLEIQLGLRPCRDGALADRITNRDRAPVVAIDGYAGRVYLPRTGLFHDILPPRHYGSLVYPSRDSELADKLTEAFRLLRQIDGGLAADLSEIVTVIALLPDEDAATRSADPMRLRWSFNLRLRYFGGVFLNLYPVDVYGTLEGLVHEYYHLRLWHWWEVARPTGIPDPRLTIVSPVTRLERQAAVMAQALLIYVGILGVYRTAAGMAVPRGASEAWLSARLDHIAGNVPALHDALRRLIPADTTLGQVLDAALEYFYADGAATGSATRRNGTERERVRTGNDAT
jgi:hypothetical protein